MRPSITTIGGGLLLLAAVLFAIWSWGSASSGPAPTAPATPAATTPTPLTSPDYTTTVIGQSVQGRDIVAHTFGSGSTSVLFVGGIHGGYEANTVRLAKGVIEEFILQPETIPSHLTVHIIPNLNPDGYALPATASNFDRRMNANGVDLNRNFDCLWSPVGTWGSVETSGGTAPFSEPEARALRDYIIPIQSNLAGAIFWHSKANAVYSSECGLGTGAAPRGVEMMHAYAAAANYAAFGMWTAYPVTGAAEDWLASLGIPAITVELETRESIEWQRNWAGVLATLGLFNE